MNFTNTDSAWVELWDDMHDNAYWRVAEHFYYQIYLSLEDIFHSFPHKIFMELCK